MVNKLRKKFVVTAMLSLLLILVIMIAVINIVNVRQVARDADELLTILSDNGGYFPGMLGPNGNPGGFTPDENMPFVDKDQDGFVPGGQNNNNPDGIQNTTTPDGQDPFRGQGDPFAFRRLQDMRSAEMPFQARYFWVKFDESGAVTETDTDHIASVTEDTAITYGTRIYEKDKENGFVHSYRYKLTKRDDGTTQIIFADISSQLINIYKLLGQSLLIGACTLIAMFILVFLFSGQAVAPVVESLEKQKRFITDAGHELKTPLAVISANVDVLELESGKSEWSASIKNQVKRMNSLVKNLLTLSRMDEERMHVVFSDFDMSATVKETAASFEAIAESKSKQYQTDIEDGIHLTGDKNAIVQLTSLLLDNAMKYSSENGSIHVVLSKDKNIVLEVSNTCDSIPSGNLDRLFDRFYRADSSRSRESGGYGIGLSVARAIAQSHGGNIEALRDGDKIIRFVVTLPKVLPKSIQKAQGK